MNKIILAVFVFISLCVGGFLLGRTKSDADVIGGQLGGNVEMRDGVQYVVITAKGGYSPKISNAKAGVPTKLVLKTNGTYDCSLAVSIRSIGYQKILSQTGEEIIDLKTPEPGKIQGLCSMGMYNFTVNFN